MDLESVFVEDPEFLDLLPALPPKIPRAPLRPGRDSTEIDRRAVARAHIAHVMKALSDRDLDAQDHYVEPYLLNHLRRNCRPSTIQTNGTAVLLFLSYLKEIGRSPLETVRQQGNNVAMDRGISSGLGVCPTVLLACNLGPSPDFCQLRSHLALRNFSVIRSLGAQPVAV
jgi:hypothetical protein